ncbi:recombination protein NinB [Hyphomonas sp. CY54-11-8]|uniref:recombination protein NinB n=1 Tax=Hyphomonas sp. CY54-11-8 TaxID=1280944 RepID=UPI000458B4BA|nr:recombination protein NinB [Hyphomonas sp. CY54-11-8]KCZ47732.1 hypothetical protein HY17_04450 [Hyphomonas sp. CY54-11-8]
MATYRVSSEAQRQTLIRDILKAPLGFVVTARRNKRSNDQNDLMWVLLTQYAKQAELRGQKWSKEQWKCIFMQKLGHEVHVLPTLDGQSWFPEGHRSSQLSKAEMSDMIELIYASADDFGVDLEEHKEAAA